MHHRFQTLIRSLLIVTMIVSSAGVSPLALAQAVTARSGYDTARARLDIVFGVIEDMQSLLDRSRFDLQALELELAFEDADGVADWVRTNIAYQPYRGVLRGGDGALAAGAGNAFDQALLLAPLLSAAGYEVRLARGQLSEDDARQLLATAARAPDDGAWRAAAIDTMMALDELGDIPGLAVAELRNSLEDLLDPYALDEQLFAEADNAAQQLSEFLAGEGVSLGRSGVDPDALAAAAEHVWVEYRLSAAQEWQPLDVLLPAGVALPEATELIQGDVPAEHLHRVRIRAFVENKVGDDFEVSEVITARSLPSANLNGVVLSYNNIPSGLTALGNGAPLAQVLDATEFYMPFVDERLAAGAMGFDLEGAVLEPEFMADQAAGVFRNVRSGFSAATSLLGGLGLGAAEEPAEPLALTGHWLEYTVIAPGGEEVSHTRMIVDRRGAEQRAAGGTSLDGQSREEVELALLHEERLMVVTGEYRPEWLLDQFFTRFLNTRTFFEYMLAVNHGVDTDITLEAAIETASPLEHLFAAAMFDAGARQSGSLSFRSAPSLLAFVSSLAGTRDDSRAVTRLDIVSNARTVLDDRGQGVAVEALLNGVWETFAEADISLAGAPEGAQSFSAARAFAAAASGGLVLIAPGADPDNLPAVSAEAARNIRTDLERGYHVIMPRSPEPGREAWYRVNAQTGETLGVTFDARGQAMTEYQIQLLDNTLTIFFAVKSFDDCQRNHAPASPGLACCFVKAHVNNLIGLGFGNGISAAYGSAYSLLFTITTGLSGTDFLGDALTC